MRVKYAIVFLALASLLIAACGPRVVGPQVSAPQPICNEPYILKGTDCCLDQNSNAICDSDERQAAALQNASECPPFDCSNCAPARPGTTRYVCPDKRTVDNPEACFSDVASVFEGYTPAASSDNIGLITNYSVAPGCQLGFNSVGIGFGLSSSPQLVKVQVKEAPDAEWKDVYTLDRVVTSKRVVGLFCDRKCTTGVDFFIAPGKAYALRTVFDFSRTYNTTIYSPETIVDATQGGEYVQRQC